MRNNLILLVIGAYLILNWGFMLVRIPPVSGGGIPLGEVLLCFSFCIIFKDIRWLPSFTNNLIFVLFLMWWSLGIGKALYAFPEYKMWALRDASHVIESLFLWVGFVFAGAPGAIDRFFVWLRRVLGIASLYALSYPWRNELGVLSPTIQAAAGYQSTIFFNYVGIGQLLLWEAARRFIERAGGILVPSLLIAFSVGLFQARTIYLQLIAIVLMLLWYRRKAFGKICVAMGVGLIALILVVESGVEIEGRNGQNVSIEYITNHFIAIAGIENPGVKGEAAGVDLRLGWWKDIIFERLPKSTGSLIFGLGYGFPLVDFKGPDGEIVREPHNSYVSILARIGLVGLLLFISGPVLLVHSWWNAFKLCRRESYQIGQDRLFILMVYFVMIWIFSMGEAAFEAPYLTIPYYFFWGVFLHYHLHLKRMLTNEEVIPHEKIRKESVLCVS
jgi:hypothetical protein